MSWTDGLAAGARAIVEALAGQTAGVPRHAPRGQVGSMAARGHFSEVLALPEVWMDPIQDLDPDSATFGLFFWQMDYDHLGS